MNRISTMFGALVVLASLGAACGSGEDNPGDDDGVAHSRTAVSGSALGVRVTMPDANTPHIAARIGTPAGAHGTQTKAIAAQGKGRGLFEEVHDGSGLPNRGAAFGEGEELLDEVLGLEGGGFGGFDFAECG